MPKKNETVNNNEMSKEELDALKEQLKKELLIEMKKDEAEKYKQEQALKTRIEESNKTEFKVPTKSKIDKFDRNIQKENKDSQVENIQASSNYFLVFVLLIVIAGIYFIPQIANMIKKDNKSKEVETEEKEKKKKEEEIVNYTWNDAIIKDITLPIMRISPGSAASYYTLDKMTVENMSNNEILFNAFVNVYTGNIGYYQGGYDGVFCGSADQQRELNAKYIDARVNNLFTKNTEYTHEDFYVPFTVGSAYYGLWRFNPNTYSYVYYGECNPQGLAGEFYYDILVKDEIKTSKDGKTAYLTYSMGFAKMIGDSYEIYRDANYTNLLISDTFKTNNQEKELENVFADYVKDHDVNKYKYTYSKTDCSYSDLCYISGEWINE